MLLRALGLALMLIALVVLTWATRAVTYRTQTATITQAELHPAGENGLPLKNPDQIAGRIFLEWPEALRLGDAGEVRLSFDPEAAQNAQAAPDGLATPDALAATQPATAEAGGEVLQSRLELAGIIHTPTGEISQALSLEHPVTFLWNLRAGQPGDFAGTTWLHLQTEQAGAGQEARVVLTAQQLDIPVMTFYGLSGAEARIIGWVGLALGLALGLGDLFFRAVQGLAQRDQA
jgi:hypothetical protein